MSPRRVSTYPSASAWSNWGITSTATRDRRAPPTASANTTTEEQDRQLRECIPAEQPDDRGQRRARQGDREQIGDRATQIDRIPGRAEVVQREPAAQAGRVRDEALLGLRRDSQDPREREQHRDDRDPHHDPGTPARERALPHEITTGRRLAAAAGPAGRRGEEDRDDEHSDDGDGRGQAQATGLDSGAIDLVVERGARDAGSALRQPQHPREERRDGGYRQEQHPEACHRRRAGR